MRESKLEAQIRKYAISKGMLVRKFVTPGHTGSPDRMFITRKGTIWFMEVKAPGKEPEALQLREQKLYRQRGIKCEWENNLESAKGQIELMEGQ